MDETRKAEKNLTVARDAAPDRHISWIDVSGFDCHGRYFTERTSIVNSVQSRCSFRVRIQMPRESVVAIRPVRLDSRIPNMRAELFEVIHAEPTLNGWHIEANKMLAQPAKLF